MLVLVCCFFFFFSSRRRYTRLVSDWSSDVCSSDLFVAFVGALLRHPVEEERADERDELHHEDHRRERGDGQTDRKSVVVGKGGGGGGRQHDVEQTETTERRAVSCNVVGERQSAVLR